MKPATDDSQEVCEMRETRDKKEHARDNMKIDNPRFAIRSFSRTIKFHLLSQEKISLSRA